MAGNHRSTQDAQSLKLLATKLKGIFHQGNNKHLPSAVIEKLSMIRPRIAEGIGLREAALLCVGLGGCWLGLLGPALNLLGRKQAEHPVRIPSRSRHSAQQALSAAGWIQKGGT